MEGMKLKIKSTKTIAIRKPKGAMTRSNNAPAAKRKRDKGTFISESQRKAWRTKGAKSIEEVNGIKNLRRHYLQVFEIIGGVEEFAAWAIWNNKNQTEFYRMLSKMLPREVNVSDSEVRPNDLSNLAESEIDAVISDALKER
jgi:hypothetical protein